MDYRILGTPTASQHNIFDSEKLSHFFLVFLTQAGFELPVFGSQVRRCTNGAIPSPRTILASNVIALIFV